MVQFFLTVRPEFLNRMDDIIMFRPLSRRDVREIVKLQLHMLMSKRQEKDIHLVPSEELIEHISETGFDPQFGARPLKRMIQKELLNELKPPDHRRDGGDRASTGG